MGAASGGTGYDDRDRWIGPPSLRLFVRHNLVFAAIWATSLTIMATGVWHALADGSWFVGIPLGLVTGVLITIAFLFPYSRGWLPAGDGEGE